jgi:hypothetical protein
MNPLRSGTLVLLFAATSASAQLPYVTRLPPHVDVIPSDTWLCRQVATSLEESTLLGTVILERLEKAPQAKWSKPVRFQHAENRLGEAIAAFAIDDAGGVIYVSDTLDGSTLLHEGTHAMMLRLTPEEARFEMTRMLAADSAGHIDPDIVDLARRSFTLSFTASANPELWGLVPMVLTTAAFSDNSHAGTLARLVRASDSAAVRLEGNVSKGWGRATIADAYDVAADSHWRYAGFPRPESWTWRDERTFRLIGEAVAYERARRCALGS